MSSTCYAQSIGQVAVSELESSYQDKEILLFPMCLQYGNLQPGRQQRSGSHGKQSKGLEGQNDVNVVGLLGGQDAILGHARTYFQLLWTIIPTHMYNLSQYSFGLCRARAQKFAPLRCWTCMIIRDRVDGV